MPVISGYPALYSDDAGAWEKSNGEKVGMVV